MHPALGTSLALFSAACFGTIAIFGKLAFKAGLRVDQLLALRYGIAALILTAMVILAGNIRALLRPRTALNILLGMSYGGQALLFFAALRSVPASLAELTLFLYPALVLLGAWAFLDHRRPGTRQLVAVGASFLGIGLLIGSVAWRITPDFGFALLAPVLYAAYLMIVQPATRHQPTLVTSTSITVGAGILWVLIAGVGGHLTLPTGQLAWLSLGGLVAFPSLLGVPALMGAIRHLGSGRVALLGTVEPVVTLFFAVILLREALSPVQVLGAVVVLASVLLVTWVPNPGMTVAEIHG